MAKKNLLELSNTELFSQLDSAKDDIFTLRMRQQTSGDDPAKSASSIRNTRRSVARLLTEIRRREINLADFTDKKPKSERKIFKTRKPEEVEVSEDATPIDLDGNATQTPPKDLTDEQGPDDQDEPAEDPGAEIDQAQTAGGVDEEPTEGVISIVTDDQAPKAAPKKRSAKKKADVKKSSAKKSEAKKPAEEKEPKAAKAKKADKKADK